MAKDPTESIHMSLVYFHIFLISVGILFSLGFGFWELNQHAQTGLTFDLATGIAAFAFGVLLAGYLAWFIKKKKPTMGR